MDSLEARPVNILQEAQLMLTYPNHAFRGQSRSPNIVPFHMLGIVSSCAIVTLPFRRAGFPVFDIKNVVTLKSGSGHSRSLKVVPPDRLRMLVFYSNFVPFLRYSTSKMPWPWQLGYGSVNVIGNVIMRYSAYDFLLTFYSNYGSILCRFWDIQCRKMLSPWNRFPRSLKVIESGAIR